MKECVYFEEMGFKESEKNECLSDTKIETAYKMAHEIRKFEIEMYWKRSTYLWAFQVVAFGGFAALASSIANTVSNTEETLVKFQMLQLSALIGIWAFGLFSAYVWSKVVEGSKFWQNNWERHVDHLEDRVSGSLYKTYPSMKGYSSSGEIIVERPYSVSKLNQAIAIFVVILWLALGVVIALTFLPPTTWWLASIFGLFVLTFLSCLFDDCLKMEKFEYDDPKPVSERSEVYLVRRKM